MSTEKNTDPSMVVPPAEQLTGESAEPDRPAVSDVFPAGEAASDEHLEPNDDDR